MARVGFVRHTDYLNHDTGFGHPERADRLKAIDQRLEESGVLSDLLLIEPEKSETIWLQKVHAPTHVANVKERCEKDLYHMGDEETMISPPSYEIARLAVGGTLGAVDAVMEGCVDTAFCAVRPPGHHAEFDRAMGFCLFNNAAVAARYIQEKHRLAKVVIVDWDVHHGNGTQHIFERDPSVFYFSTHQFPHYPWFSGGHEEKGIGPGQGANLNIPLPAGSGNQQQFDAFDQHLLPAMEQFDPDFVIISAGFDAHSDDPLSALQVSESCFGDLTQRLKALAASHAQGRLISVLEGGYDLPSLSRSVEQHIRVLMDE